MFNAENKWVVEPGDFKVMIGVSSEDIRLEGLFTVVDKAWPQKLSSDIDQANEIMVISDPISADAKNILDNIPATYWSGEKDNSITITLSALKKINSIDINWGNKTEINAEFEVQLSKGGGQFLDFYKGKLIDLSESKIMIDESGISDIRIIVKSKKVYITKVVIK